MHHLAGAMDTGVGAAGAKDGNRFVRHLRERLFQLLLHAAHFVLPLPAVIFATVVLDAQRDFTDRLLLHLRHQYRYSSISFSAIFTAISAPPKRTLSATDQNWTCSGMP